MGFIWRVIHIHNILWSFSPSSPYHLVSHFGGFHCVWCVLLMPFPSSLALCASPLLPSSCLTIVSLLFLVILFRFHVLGRTCGVCLSESGLLQSTRWSPELSIFLWMAEFHSFSLHPIFCSSVDWHLGRFHILATVNCAAINIGMQVSL